MPIKADKQTLENFEKELEKKGDGTAKKKQNDADRTLQRFEKEQEKKQAEVDKTIYATAKALFRDWNFDLDIAYLCAYHFFNQHAEPMDVVDYEALKKVRSCRRMIELDRMQVSDLLLAYSEVQ